jgi:hypothetical protein
MTLPELPARHYQWRHDARQRRWWEACSLAPSSTPDRRRVRSAQFAVVGVVDAVLIAALIHPAFTRWILIVTRH